MYAQWRGNPGVRDGPCHPEKIPGVAILYFAIPNFSAHVVQFSGSFRNISLSSQTGWLDVDRRSVIKLIPRCSKKNDVESIMTSFFLELCAVCVRIRSIDVMFPESRHRVLLV
jgi:hypothetical protein